MNPYCPPLLHPYMKKYEFQAKITLTTKKHL
jgi:hypothetical protein